MPQYDPFKEYANDSTDDESLDTKQASDEDSDDSENGAPAIEKVFLKSVAYKKRSKDVQPPKRARFDSETPLDYAEELYEFGKLVADQLLCLDVEEARIAQEEIRAVLSKFEMNKEKHSFIEPSNSAQPTNKPCVTHVVQSKPSKKTKKVKAASSVSQAVYTHVNTAGPSTPLSEVYARSPGSRSPPEIRQSSLRTFSVVNVKDGLAAPFGYVIVPTVTDSGEINLIPQIGTKEGTIVTQPAPMMRFAETEIKIEPAEPDNQGDVIMPNVIESESLIIKYEPHSDDET